MRSSRRMLPGPIERALSRREPIDMPIAVVVAHPDDETVGAGPLLHLFRRLTLVHVTDGAPRDKRDAEAAGFASCAEYAAARSAELHEALRIGGVMAERVELGVPDQQAAYNLSWLAGALRRRLADVDVVFTHAYEGGHPDHDSVALAVQQAGLPRVEMTGYHAAANGGIEVGAFLPGSAETVLPLTPAECSVREAMLDAFRTQQATLRPFRGAAELRFRPAPRYDFTRPPADRIYYDGFPWGMTSGQWCALAADALR